MINANKVVPISVVRNQNNSYFKPENNYLHETYYIDYDEYKEVTMDVAKELLLKNEVFSKYFYNYYKNGGFNWDAFYSDGFSIRINKRDIMKLCPIIIERIFAEENLYEAMFVCVLVFPDNELVLLDNVKEKLLSNKIFMEWFKEDYFSGDVFDWDGWERDRYGIRRSDDWEDVLFIQELL